MEMNPTEPDPNNPSNAAHPRVEDFTRVRGASRGERWFRSLVQNSSDVVMILEADGTVRYVSPAVERVLGYRTEDFVGTLALDYVHPEDLEHMSKSFAETLEQPGVHPPVEYRVRAADGSWRYMEAIRSNWLGDPHVAGVVANVRDITERKRAEKTLKESEKYFRSLVQNASDVVLVMEADHTVRYISPAVERVLGYKPEQVVGNDNFTPVHPDDMPRMEKLIGEVMGSPGITTSSRELRLRHADDSWRYVETTCTNLLGDPAVGGIVFNTRDVTERKRTEQALKESEERFRSSFRDAAIGMALVATDGRWLQVNHSLCEMVGYPQEELLGKTFQDITYPDDLEADLDLLSRMLSGEIQTYQMEKRYLHKEGHVLWILLSVSMVHDEDGKPLYFVSQIQDITERKRTGEALRRSESSLATAQRIAHLGNWDYDVTKDEAQWSDEMYRIFGFAPRQFVPRYRTFLNSVHPDDRSLIRRSVRKALYEEKQGSVEYRVVRPDGEIRVVQSQYEVVRDMSGRAVKLVGTVQDITERKAAEEALKESEERYRTLMEQSVEAIYLYDAETKRILESNAAFQRLMGYAEEELLGMRIYDFIDHDDEDIDRHVGRSLKEKQRHIGERRYHRKDGSVILVDTSASVISYGGRVSLCSVSRDVTERREAEEAVRRSEARLAEAQRLAHLGGWEWDVRTGEISWSDEVYRIYGLAPQSSVPSFERFMEIVHPDDRELVGKVIDEALKGSEPYDVEHRVVRPDGEMRVVHRRAEVMRGEGGEPLRMVGTVHDITERKEAEEALREAEERYRTVVEEQTELVCRFLPDLTLTFVNDAYCRYFGLEPGEAIGRSFIGRVAVEDRVYYEQQLAWLNRENPRRTVEHRVLTPDGGVRWQQWTDTAIFDGEGRIVEYQSVGRDVTERKALEERLEHQALHDSLTDLPNRQLLVDRLKQAISRTRRRRGRKVGVLFMDLDGFKVVNDSLGHDTGDRLLVEVAERLGGCLRPEDTLARFGGDEFIVLLEEVEGADDALRVTQRITEEFRGPFVLDGRELILRLSIGVALGEADTKSPEELLRDADTAMYRAKEDAVDYRVFDPQMHEQALSRLELENDLRHALEKEEFTVYYQPKFRLGQQQDRIEGVEALVRWEHPQRDFMLPDEFIPIAEEMGLIISIGGWVTKEACRQAKEWQERYPSEPPLAVCVNLSAGQVRHPGLLKDVRSALQESGLEPGSLILEITEGTLLKDTKVIETVFKELKALGVRLAIDDFGKEYSSLSYLNRLPVDGLKIDRLFLESFTENPSNMIIVEAVISLAHSLGLEVTGEGVERAEQLELLRRMGCDLVQGYHLARPLPSEEVEQLLADHFTEVQQDRRDSGGP